VSPFREAESLGNVGRAAYTYGMLRAADTAKQFGLTDTTVIEFGVAEGNGLRDMIAVAPHITAETGVRLNIVGFDSGGGLPPPRDYRDHPEVWSKGEFKNSDCTRLMDRIAGRAEMIWGDIAETGPQFFGGDALKEAPLGFAAIDVDLYSSAVAVLNCFNVEAHKFNPAVSLYFDDTSFFFANEWCGELMAIEEFNAAKTWRKISADRSLPWARKTVGPWVPGMRVLHVLDHVARQGK
jgi:hypothetical protein